MNNLCPLCNAKLIDSIYGRGVYECPKTVLIKINKLPHYIRHNTYDYIKHEMIVLPYKVLTYDDYSVIQKINKNNRAGTGLFDNILYTTDLNIDPILPMSEKDLLNRLQTILVFS